MLVSCIKRHTWGKPTVEENTAECESEIKAWYKQRKEKSKLRGELNWKRLKTEKGWPKIKAKAAACRHLVEYAFDLSSRHLRDEPRIIAIVQLLLEFYQLCENEKMYMRDPAIRRIQVIGRQICQLYAQLANEAKDRGEKVFKMTPKFHLFVHLTEWVIPSTKLNPRSYWCYGDEDLVGTLVEVAENCHPFTMSTVALTKWALLEFD